MSCRTGKASVAKHSPSKRAIECLPCPHLDSRLQQPSEARKEGRGVAHPAFVHGLPQEHENSLQRNPSMRAIGRQACRLLDARSNSPILLNPTNPKIPQQGMSTRLALLAGPPRRRRFDRPVSIKKRSPPQMPSENEVKVGVVPG